MTQSSLQLRSARPFTVYIRVGILLTGRTHMHDCIISIWTHNCSLTRPLLVDLACSVADDWVVVGDFKFWVNLSCCSVLDLFCNIEYPGFVLFNCRISSNHTVLNKLITWCNGTVTGNEQLIISVHLVHYYVTVLPTIFCHIYFFLFNISFVVFSVYWEPHRWCDCKRTVLESGRSWVLVRSYQTKDYKICIYYI